MPEEVMQYGASAAVMTAMLGLVMKPIIQSMIQQNKRSLEILQESLDQNTKTIERLKEMEAGSLLSRQALAETQTEILASLRSLERTLAAQRPRTDTIE